MSSASPRPAGSTAAAVLAMLLAILLVLLPGMPPGPARGESVPDHLVISEVVTGGASASDELIELYNPSASPLPLEGLELVYVSASGATISRRAAWALGAPSLEPGQHLLVANELGVYAGIADALYASGMAATGGSVALRIQGAGSAIDAVGWGTAASAWLEGQVAAAPASGSSLERLPGGAAGSTQDTDDNASDFVVRPVPEPQNLGSPPVPDPSATPTPIGSPSAEPTVPPPSASATATATPSGTASPDPSVEVVPIATARALPDGTEVTVEGVALTDASFSEGGGYVADSRAGIAVIVSGATFERGERLRLTGGIDDRFAQRTLRVEAAGIVSLGTAPEPASPIPVATGAVAEGLEGVLVRAAGTIVGSASTLTTGVAFDLDDGSGAVRLVVGTSTGIDVAGWDDGTALVLVGVVGQRDATGSGVAGYRVQPRDRLDIITVGVPSPTPAPSASDEPGIGVVSIAAARDLPKNARARVRGTVTLEPGIVDPTTAVIQDRSGAIVLRVGDDEASLARGDLVEVDGVRSTRAGMETLRVSSVARRIDTGSDPVPRELRTGAAGEPIEAQLVRVRGSVLSGVRRASTGSVSFEIDDGSGPLRVYVAGPVEFDGQSISTGAWVDVVGILGQETTGAQPLRGYRVWPRQAPDIRLVAGPTGSPLAGGAADWGSPSVQRPGVLDAVGASGDTGMRIGATLVVGPWPELGLGAVLWDGVRLAGVHLIDAAAVEAAAGGRRAPVAVELVEPRAIGFDPTLGIPLLRVSGGDGIIARGTGRAMPPSTGFPRPGGQPRWVAIVGRVGGTAASPRVMVRGEIVQLDIRCDDHDGPRHGVAAIAGIAAAATDGVRLVVPCGGIRPAPLMERRSVSPGEARDGGSPPGSREPSTTPRATSMVPAAMLGLAALTLVASAVIARRVRVGGPEPDDGATGGSADDGLEPSLPVITLVPMPRERAP